MVATSMLGLRRASPCLHLVYGSTAAPLAETKKKKKEKEKEKEKARVAGARQRALWRTFAFKKRGGRRGRELETGVGLFDFDDVDEFEEGEGRPPLFEATPSKNESKRKAKEFLQAAEFLTSLKTKQLKQLTPHLDEDLVDLVKQAQKLPRRNQGRKRLEATIAKSLRLTNTTREWVYRTLDESYHL